MQRTGRKILAGRPKEDTIRELTLDDIFNIKTAGEGMSNSAEEKHKGTLAATPTGTAHLMTDEEQLKKRKKNPHHNNPATSAKKALNQEEDDKTNEKTAKRQLFNQPSTESKKPKGDGRLHDQLSTNKRRMDMRKRAYHFDDVQLKLLKLQQRRIEPKGCSGVTHPPEARPIERPVRGRSLILPLLNLVLGRLTISNRYITMVLSLLDQPPTSKPSTPPTIEESMAKLAYSIDKLELVMKQVKIETTSPIIDINNHDNTMAQVLITTASQHANIETIMEDHPTINMTTENRVTTIPNIKTKITTQTPCSPCNTAHKLSETQTRNLSIHLVVEQTYVYDMLIEDMLVIFRCVETFPPAHQFHPPKFVFIESEDDPPWEPNDPRYKTMSLEDKARFKGGSIDTYLYVHRGLMN
nr:hypothetical protein [Tanacetum cinerariifolium]